MKNMNKIRERYMKDGLPIRLGGLAANLARVSSFSKNPNNRDAVNGLLEESKYFIEWTATEAELETTAELVELQIKLALWQLNLDKTWDDEEKRLDIGQQAKHWSNEVLKYSGLLG